MAPGATVDGAQDRSRRLAYFSRMGARAAVLCAMGALLVSCAGAPETVPPEEDIPVRVRDLAGFGDTVEIPGFACTISSGSKTWTVTTPATVRVPRSQEPLHVECAKEGYKTQRFDRACRTARERETPHNLERSLIELPLGILTLPASPYLLVDSMAGLGERAYTASQPGGCSYGPIELLAIRLP